MAVVFLQNYSSKYPDKAFFFPDLDILLLDKFEGADVKNNNIGFLKSLTQKYPNREFLVPRFGFLFFFAKPYN